MRWLSSLFCLLLLLCLTPLPAHGAGLGVGGGVLGTDPVGVGHFRWRSGALLERLLKITPPVQIIAFGITPRESGFLDDRGLSRAFLGAGYWFGLGKEDPLVPTRRYVTALLMAFPDDPDDGVNIGGLATFGIQRATTFSSGFPGAYFAEVGAAACGEFVTVFIQTGIFAGK